MSKSLTFGVIGMSEGNGHPYSWSAICNGYDRHAMELCGFPVIPRYLEQQSWPASALSNVAVTHVWTQERSLSETVARAALIPTVVDAPEEMIGAVDGILLARDDAETHLAFAEPFLKAGLPVYIDKPICLSLSELDRLYSLEQYPGQIFSCSALRYSPEFQLSADDREKIGPIREIHAITPKYWNTYAVHVIEPLLALAGDVGTLKGAQVNPRSGGGCTVTAEWSSGFRAIVTAMGGDGPQCPLTLRVMGDCGWRDLVFSDSFTAFRAALQDFVDGVRARDVRTDRELLQRAVQLIEIGKQG